MVRVRARFRHSLAALLIALAAAPAARAGDPFEMVDIPAGSFEAGDPDGRADEAPAR